MESSEWVWWVISGHTAIAGIVGAGIARTNRGIMLTCLVVAAFQIFALFAIQPAGNWAGERIAHAYPTPVGLDWAYSAYWSLMLVWSVALAFVIRIKRRLVRDEAVCPLPGLSLDAIAAAVCVGAVLNDAAAWAFYLFIHANNPAWHQVVGQGLNVFLSVSMLVGSIWFQMWQGAAKHAGS